MSDDTQDHGGHSGNRRDFLYLSAGAFAGVGGAIALWPFVDSLNPSADVLALSTVEVDVSQVEVGQRVTVKWQGKPVFIDHRTEEAIAEARDTPLSDLRDPQTDEARAERAQRRRAGLEDAAAPSRLERAQRRRRRSRDRRGRRRRGLVQV